MVQEQEFILHVVPMQELKAQTLLSEVIPIPSIGEVEFVCDNSTVTIDGLVGTVEINNNLAGNYGGGLATFLSDITLNNVDFNNNTAIGANGDGGGIFRLGYSIFNMTNVNYSGNTATRGTNNIN